MQSRQSSRANAGMQIYLNEENTMIGYYSVYYDGQLLAQGIRAYSESDAIEQVWMKTGSASAYSGRARRLYTAVRG